MIDDLRYALRMFWRAPLFALSATAALALGIGANTAVFSIVYSVMLKPLPYSEPDRLVRLSERNPATASEQAVLSAGTFIDWRTRSRGLDSLAVYAPLFANGETVWNIGDRAQIVKTAGVSRSLFAVLRVQPMRGRLFRAESENPPAGALGQFLISYGLWQRAFGGTPDIVGRQVNLEGRLPREIIGVMPPGFDFPDGTEAWTSVPLEDVAVAQRRARSFQAIGRLSPGTTVDDLTRELRGISAQLAVEYPESNAGWIPGVELASDSRGGSARLALIVLMAAVAGVLLIACANVANLLLARAVARRDEVAVRLALGAGTGRLVRHAVAEAGLLCVAGTAAGVVIGTWIAGVLARLAPIDMATADGGTLNAAVLTFSAVACAICVGLTGIVPALHVARSASRHGLRGDLRSATTRRAGFRRWVIAGEAAVVVVLLSAALLFLRSFINLRHVDLGFQPGQVLALETRWPVGHLLQTSPGARPWPRVQHAVDDLVQTVEGVPGVQAAGLITEIPLTSDPFSGTVWRADAAGASNGGHPVDTRDRWRADLSVVTPGYFEAMGITFALGRNFGDTDRYSDELLAHPGTRRVGSAIVNLAFASHYFQGIDPVGRTIVVEADQEFGPARTIVGVVTDARQRSVAETARPTVFIPHAQHPDMIRPSLVVRTSGSPDAVAPLIRERLAALDPQLVVLRIRPLDDVISGAISRPRFNLLLMGSFAAIALVLAALGIYAVLACVVTERTREIGIRMALGARQVDVVHLILREGLTSVVFGAMLGVAGTLVASRVLRALLFGVGPLDPVSVAGSPALLAIIALVACYVPTRRAARVDPIIALREN